MVFMSEISKILQKYYKGIAIAEENFERTRNWVLKDGNSEENFQQAGTQEDIRYLL